MEDVTDCAFREMFARYGKPDVMFTEFVNVDGLLHPEGSKRLAIDLKYTEAQRPIVAQIWGRDPEKFYQAALLLAKMGFDGIDINMGCPQDKEISLRSCAALILEPELAKTIILSTKKGAGGLPVSVKTRIGYSQNTVSEWVKHLLDTEPSAITIHGRTKKQKSKVPADWQAIAEAVKVRDGEKSQSLIIGNGDIKSLNDGLQKAKETGVDGIMVGRGAFGNPWLFNPQEISIEQKLNTMLEHAKLFEKWLGQEKSFMIMRKHFKAYVNGFENAAELRAKLMETKNLAEAELIANDFLMHQKV